MYNTTRFEIKINLVKNKKKTLFNFLRTVYRPCNIGNFMIMSLQFEGIGVLLIASG